VGRGADTGGLPDVFNDPVFAPLEETVERILGLIGVSNSKFHKW
jgi:hypothetical protein